MKYGNPAVISLVLGTLAAVATPLAAQNEKNWHIQSNGFDGIYVGLGVGGGLVTTADGVGKWVAGEDLRGSRKAAFSGDFGFKARDVLVTHCLLVAGGSSAQFTPLLTWWEFDGRNPNRPHVFTNPTCTVPGLVMGSAVGAPLGDPPGTTASLIALGLPTALGTATVFLPNNGLLPTSNGGTLALIAAVGIAGGTATVPTGCYSFEIGAVTTIVASLDDIDGWWIWHQDAAGGPSTNYYGFSFDEQDLWQSGTLHGVVNGTGVLGFPATTEWSYHHTSLEAATTAALAPAGSATPGEGQYYGVTVNTNGGFGASPPSFDFNGGYDVGAGSHALSLGGTTGYADFNDVLVGAPIAASQDPAGSSGVSPTYVTPSLGMQTWDTRDYNGNGIPDDGGDKISLLAFHWDLFAGLNPDVAADVLGSPGTRLPVTDNGGSFVGGDFPQAMTIALIPVFAHTVIGGTPGFPGPEGPIPTVPGFVQAGTSSHIPTSTASGTCLGVEIGLTYGTVHLVGGNPTYNPAEGSTSGRKVLFLLD